MNEKVLTFGQKLKNKDKEHKKDLQKKLSSAYDQFSEEKNKIIKHFEEQTFSFKQKISILKKKLKTQEKDFELTQEEFLIEKLSLEETLKTLERQKHSFQKKGKMSAIFNLAKLTHLTKLEISMIQRIKTLNADNKAFNSDKIEYLLEAMIKEKQETEEAYETELEELRTQNEMMSSRSRAQTTHLESKIRDLEKALIDSEFYIQKLEQSRAGNTQRSNESEVSGSPLAKVSMRGKQSGSQEKKKRVILGELPNKPFNMRRGSLESSTTDNTSKPAGMIHTFIKNGSELTIGLLVGKNKLTLDSRECDGEQVGIENSKNLTEGNQEPEADLKNTLTSKSSMGLSNLKLTKITENVKNKPVSPKFTPRKNDDLSHQSHFGDTSRRSSIIKQKSSRHGKSVSRSNNKKVFKSPLKLSEIAKQSTIHTSEYQPLNPSNDKTNIQPNESSNLNDIDNHMQHEQYQLPKELNKTETLKKLFTSSMNLKQAQGEKNNNNLKKSSGKVEIMNFYSMENIDLASMDPSYQAICYKEFHSIELKFRHMLEERDQRFSKILESKDKKIKDLTLQNSKLQKKIEDIKSQLF